MKKSIALALSFVLFFCGFARWRQGPPIKHDAKLGAWTQGQRINVSPEQDITIRLGNIYARRSRARGTVRLLEIDTPFLVTITFPGNESTLCDDRNGDHRNGDIIVGGSGNYELILITAGDLASTCGYNVTAG